MTEELLAEVRKLLMLDFDYEGTDIVARQSGARILQGISNGWLAAGVLGVSTVSAVFKEKSSSKKQANIPETVLYGMGKKIKIVSEPDYEAVLHMGGIGKPSVILLSRHFDEITVTCCMPKGVTSVVGLQQLMAHYTRRLPEWIEKQA